MEMKGKEVDEWKGVKLKMVKMIMMMIVMVKMEWR